MGLTNVDLDRIDGNSGLLSNVNTSSINGGPLAGTRNRIINGDMRIDQRNAGAAVTVNTNPVYTLDRWYGGKNGTVNNPTFQRSTVAPVGFTNSLLVTAGTGVTPASGDFLFLSQSIEGFNFSDLGWGAAGAQAITLSFWVRSSLTGSFGVGLRNGSANRAYIASYAINAANTWEYKTVTIPGDTTGTWATDNTLACGVFFDLGNGATFSSSAGSWQASNLLGGLTGGVKLAATTGATFYLTGVQLEAGSVATPFERRSYGQELALCQRYYERLVNDRDGGGAQNIFIIYGIGGGNAASCTLSWAATKRVAPTVTVSNNTNTNITSLGVNSTTSNVTFQPSVTSAGMAQMSISAGATWLTASSEL
jgi:hypothetical protein